MSKQRIFISVVIPTFGRPGSLRDCLSALTLQTWPRDRFEVIVVDDGSPELLDDVVRLFLPQLDITLIRQENAGPGAARNRGAGVARGELLAFTDDDCLPAPSWLVALAEAHVMAPADLLGGCTEIPDDANQYAVTSQLVVDSAYRFYNRNPENARFFASNNMAIPAGLFRAIYGFAEKFRIASEDRDLCDRWNWEGHNLRYVPAAVVRHHQQLRLGSYIKQHFNYGRGARQYHQERKNRGSGTLARELGAHGRFLSEVGSGLSGMSPGEKLRVGCLLGLWQGANAAGYLLASLFGNDSRKQPV